MEGTALFRKAVEVDGELMAMHVTEISDERCKKYIKQLQSNALEKVMKLVICTFELRNDASSGSQTGFCAQQVGITTRLRPAYCSCLCQQVQ